MIETVITCDRCGKEHRANWSTTGAYAFGVRNTKEHMPDGWTTIYFDETGELVPRYGGFDHCMECTVLSRSDVTAATRSVLI